MGELATFAAPRGRGPYGITTTPDGAIFYASLAGSHIARIDPATAQATPIEPPTPGQGARRIKRIGLPCATVARQGTTGC